MLLIHLAIRRVFAAIDIFIEIFLVEFFACICEKKKPFYSRKLRFFILNCLKLILLTKKNFSCFIIQN